MAVKYIVRMGGPKRSYIAKESDSVATLIIRAVKRNANEIDKAFHLAYAGGDRSLSRVKLNDYGDRLVITVERTVAPEP